MFCAVSTTDCEVVKKIVSECGGVYDDATTMHLLFILENEVSGCACAHFCSTDTVRISYIGLLERAKGKGFGDFLTRSMINKVMDLATRVEVASTDDYFLKFGFKKAGCVMYALSKDIVFPSKCAH